MAFSVFHLSGMVTLRHFIYGLMGETYDCGPLLLFVIYEYRKDLAVYILIMAVLYAYREIIRLRMGEAQLLPQHPGSGVSALVGEPGVPEDDDRRILVSKSGLFHFINPSDIDSVEAAGNYVELHVESDTFMLRATMREIEARLGAADFARIHRSTIVKKDAVERVVSAMNGDKVLKLKNGREFRLSRRYRQNFIV